MLKFGIDISLLKYSMIQQFIILIVAESSRNIIPLIKTLFSKET